MNHGTPVIVISSADILAGILSDVFVTYGSQKKTILLHILRFFVNIMDVSFFKSDSTLHMLGTNEIQEAIHRTTNSEKLEADLIAAINHVIGQMCHIGKNCMKYPCE